MHDKIPSKTDPSGGVKLPFEDAKSVMEADPPTLFCQWNRSSDTDRMYTHMLKRVLCKICKNMLDEPFEERVTKFVRCSRADPEWCRDMMLGISRLMCKRTELPVNDRYHMSPSTIHTYFAPIMKLFDMNDSSDKFW